MIALTLNNESALGKYCELLIELHALISRDLGESNEADEIRDKMDVPWRQMSPGELKLVRGLSTDLYAIQSPSTVESRDIEIQQSNRLAQSLNRENWNVALAITRENQSHIGADELAIIRGVCWAHLGCPHVAVHFLRQIQKHRALTDAETLWLLTCLLHADFTREAEPIADDIARNSSNPRLLMKAAEVYSMRAAEASPNESERFRQLAIRLAERGLDDTKDEPRDDVLDVLRISAYLDIAVIRLELGDVPNAANACLSALRIDPMNENALILLGWINSKAPEASTSGQIRRLVRREITTGLETTVSSIGTQFQLN